MEGSVLFLYAAVGITLAAIVGYLLVVRGRLEALRRERAALERDGDWDNEGGDDALPRRTA